MWKKRKKVERNFSVTVGKRGRRVGKKGESGKVVHKVEKEEKGCPHGVEKNGKM